MPLPPMPSTRTLAMSSPSGRPSTVVPASIAASHLLGQGRGRVEHARACRCPVGSGPWRSRHEVTGLERRLDALGLGLGQQPLVLGVVDRLGLVDQHDRDVVLDRVATLQAGVVERVLALEVEERTLVLGAGEDVEQLRGRGPSGSSPGCGDEGEDLGDVRVALGPGRGFEVEAQQRLGVRRAQVEPPVPRSTVSPSSRSWSASGNAPATRSITASGSSTLVLISPESA